MRGIETHKAEQNSKRYRAIYDDWKAAEETLAELGDKYDLTKQRVWQIVTRCKLGDGDYYRGVQIARNKWTELMQLYQDNEQSKRAYNEWLEEVDVKLASDNQKVAPHTGWL